ncbi:MAG: phage Gp37/Gp68 family protein [Agitococcus sp.]|nr:phage Gp37/Gp68 family protein [Agitococcus sp.]
MSKETEIAWTDSTFNPWWGCQKVGPGCDHCYAESLDKRTGGAHWGPGAERRRTSIKNWNDPIRWNKQADLFFAKHGRRQRVFCASMADVFDNAVNPQWRADLFELIEKTPRLDWLLLTKRIGNVVRMQKEAVSLLPKTETAASSWGPLVWPANVWLGITVVNQEEADRDIPKLLAVPVATRFLSMEPLLGRVSVFSEATGELLHVAQPARANTSFSEIQWVIVGGESGSGARPMHPEWVRNLLRQCAAAKVPFLFKQWGEWRPMQESEIPFKGTNCHLVSDGSHPTIASGTFQMAHQIRSMILDPKYSWQHPVVNMGKKGSGRLLDGVLYDAFPRG